MIKRYIQTTILILLFLFGNIQPAQAQGLPVFDLQTFLKENIGDAIAWLAGSGILGALTRSTTDWVNTGFETVARGLLFDENGEPYVAEIPMGGGTSFVLNPSAFFQNMSLDSAATFFSQFEEVTSGNLETIFSDFRSDLLREIAQETQGSTESIFDRLVSDFQTPEQIAQRDAYLNDFTAGGWDMFLQTTQNCANNYACTRLMVVDELNARMTEVTETAEADLQQGGGFLSMKTCAEYAPSTNTEMGDALGCSRYEQVTPGKLVGEQITKAVAVEFERAGEVDELTEAVLSILEQVVGNLINTGLSALNDQFQGVNWDSAYSDAADNLPRPRPSRGLPPDDTEEDGELCEPYPEGGGTVCVDPRTITLSGESLGETVQITFGGGIEVLTAIELDFPEDYSDFVSVSPENVLLEATGDDGNLTVVPVTIMLSNLNGLRSIENFSGFDGTVTIGPLVIEVVVEDAGI